MRRPLLAALLITIAPLTLAPAATAQPAPAAPLAGTRLDLSVTGEVSRVPDVAVISAGVVSRAQTATAALTDNAARMERVRAALRRAGIADRDVQTSSINLNPDYRYDQNQPPVLTGYQASNSLSVRFRDLRNAGRILDALVAEGANQINGPTLSLDKPDAALDEARTRAIALGRQRADLYARSLGMRVVRLVSVSENGSGGMPPGPVPYVRAMAAKADTVVEPGEQQLQVSLAMSFELQ
ncbi:SIMPL domain-containing protein [Sphingomonas ginkgonis]|uniref:SIMPL domain-containing protein n=1 Tax=Sphingomonas ginkgonis TaxID=2315330 RepID=A0A3R9YP60_9SPHN|nr:SIMPL domain-containing protein [Sphingomonas ginkgonis]RST31955.1 SIMPL domain-containing protein [Sphingomonas ginkgonis]